MNSVFEDPDKIDHDPEIDEIVKYFSDEIKKFRKEKKISQMDIADEVGIAQKSISEIEAGSNFKIRSFAAICRGMGVVPRLRFVKPQKAISKIST